MRSNGTRGHMELSGYFFRGISMLYEGCNTKFSNGKLERQVCVR